MLQELDNEYKAKKEPVEQAKIVIQDKLLAEMTKAETLSTRFEDFTITRRKSSRAVVVDERKAVAFLESNGMEQGILKTVHPEVLKQIEKGTRLPLDGVTVETKEYISIRQADSKK
jgi:hypothetical protein